MPRRSLRRRNSCFSEGPLLATGSKITGYEEWSVTERAIAPGHSMRLMAASQRASVTERAIAPGHSFEIITTDAYMSVTERAIAPGHSS